MRVVGFQSLSFKSFKIKKKHRAFIWNALCFFLLSVLCQIGYIYKFLLIFKGICNRVCRASSVVLTIGYA